jgi:hypothetical protein
MARIAARRTAAVRRRTSWDIGIPPLSRVDESKLADPQYRHRSLIILSAPEWPKCATTEAAKHGSRRPGIDDKVGAVEGKEAR